MMTALIAVLLGLLAYCAKGWNEAYNEVTSLRVQVSNLKKRLAAQA